MEWEYKGSFLENWDRARRSTVTNFYCFAVRGRDWVHNQEEIPPTKDVKEVLKRVQIAVIEKMESPWISDEQQEMCEIFKDVLFTPESREFAQHIINREQVPIDLKHQMREDATKIYQQKAMKDKPPSEKQLEWIRKKGWNLEMPKTMAEASKILDMLFKK